MRARGKVNITGYLWPRIVLVRKRGKGERRVKTRSQRELWPKIDLMREKG